MARRGALAGPAYPVRVDGRLDAELSRWLWLVKWLLAIPHVIVLALLWVAFIPLSLVALVAILATKHYPQRLFAINVGILRWTWRVTFYAFGANGVDRSPPFSLGEEPDSPATLAIESPGELSRGLALVKWWLLLIPHDIVVGILIGGGVIAAHAGGLISILVLIAMVALLVTGTYPRPLYDLVLGLNRWVLRVAAYGALMTDRYPPFRLDQGGDDPASLAVRAP